MAPVTSRGLSLANKCQVLFGLAVLLILTAALSVPWFRLQRLEDETAREDARQIAEAWLANEIQLGVPAISQSTGDENGSGGTAIGGLRVRVIHIDEADLLAESDSFIASTLEAFRRASESKEKERFTADRIRRDRALYRYARALHVRDMEGVRDPLFSAFQVGMGSSELSNPLVGLILIENTSSTAEGRLFVNRVYLILAGGLAGALAILVFYFITTRLILSPVRVLQETAERVSRGDLNIRSDINTGDEFEELSSTFNLMLVNMKSSQDQLRQINKTLDLRINELAASNVLLEQANQLKSEFLANVSHELRTPLNSILGFAEVIQEFDTGHVADEGSVVQKRQRYVGNIIHSGKHLLEMINDLLDLAKIEAGRLDINPEPTNVREVCEGLATLMRPQTEKKSISLLVTVSDTLPLIETDSARFQQIIFNFLSNAVKFTPAGGTVTLLAERQREREHGEMVRIAVSDTGPGISMEDQQFIFQKFRQVDASHTRQHAGTGLGLAICKELAELLGGEIILKSEMGAGSTFELHLPTAIKREEPQALMPHDG